MMMWTGFMGSSSRLLHGNEHACSTKGQEFLQLWLSEFHFTKHGHRIIPFDVEQWVQLVVFA